MGVACGRAFGYIFPLRSKDTASIPNAVYSRHKIIAYDLMILNALMVKLRIRIRNVYICITQNIEHH